MDFRTDNPMSKQRLPVDPNPTVSIRPDGVWPHKAVIAAVRYGLLDESQSRSVWSPSP
ncbi:hypothetical protein N5K21_26805 [Rhizobium pusense]|uniref:hypothetical protein n=1 Tax=Agrobacterium pusense TaxID=648995 RepID=UPI002448316A|nr:hypothetical protein [Agrobacterium pusense]MDH2092334.1 hypothetical protein [Agrobacterium pusense]